MKSLVCPALFVAFAAYYVFNLEYPKPVKNIATLFLSRFHC